MYVLIRASTWSRESHGLFDYEAKVQSRQNLRASESSLVLRRGNEVYLRPLASAAEEIVDGVKLLAVLLIQPGSVLLINDVPGHKTPRPLIEKMWLVVSSLANSANHGYRISEGEVVRLGRISFRVKEFVCPHTESAPDQPLKVIPGNIISLGGLSITRPRAPAVETPIYLTIADEVDVKEGEKVAAIACKICLADTFTDENPMISPCTCKGTMRFIHLECLQRWLDSKITIRERGNSRSYSWKSLECSLCKARFPSSVVIKGKTFDLINIPKPEGEFVILEAVQRDRNAPQAIHLIPLQNKNNVRLGRSQDSDMRISDISVSRNHALIRYLRGQLVLEDNESKFGTLVQIRKPVSLDPQTTFSVQCGKSVLAISCRQKTSCFSCFGCGRTEQEDPLQIDQLESLEQESSDEERNFTNESVHQQEEEDDQPQQNAG